MTTVAFKLFQNKPLDIKAWRMSRPLGISCTNTCSDPEILLPDYTGSPRLSIDECQVLASDLIQLQDHGCTIVTCYGSGFDFNILAEECRDITKAKQLARLALSHIDIQMSIFCERGVWVSLARLCVGMGIKRELSINASEIPDLWHNGKQQQVMDFLNQDTKCLLQCYKAIKERNLVRWITGKGTFSDWKLTNNHFPTVAESIIKADPNVSWWTSRRSFRQALNEELNWIYETLDMED